MDEHSTAREAVASFADSQGLRFVDGARPLSVALSPAPGGGSQELSAATGILPGSRRGTVAHVTAGQSSLSVVLFGFDAWPPGGRVVRARHRRGVLAASALGWSEQEIQRHVGTAWALRRPRSWRVARRYDVITNQAGLDVFRALSSAPVVRQLRAAPPVVSFELLGSELCVTQAHVVNGASARRSGLSVRSLRELTEFGVGLAREIEKVGLPYDPD